jgi:hypothetical protein
MPQSPSLFHKILFFEEKDLKEVMLPVSFLLAIRDGVCAPGRSHARRAALGVGMTDGVGAQARVSCDRVARGCEPEERVGRMWASWRVVETYTNL